MLSKPGILPINLMVLRTVEMNNAQFDFGKDAWFMMGERCFEG